MKLSRQIVLASKSPRRKELLESLGIEFLIHPSNFEERETCDKVADSPYEKVANIKPSKTKTAKTDIIHSTPDELALYNAIGKAQDVMRHYRDALIIGVDTVVAFREHFLGKPKDKEDAKRILRILSNTTHTVTTAICIIDSKSGKNVSCAETTLVTIDRLEEADIEAYINSGEGADKAGGYAIQGLGALFCKRIEGDYFNVVGLPIYRLRKVLKEFGLKRVI